MKRISDASVGTGRVVHHDQKIVVDWDNDLKEERIAGSRVPGEARVSQPVGSAASAAGP